MNGHMLVFISVNLGQNIGRWLDSRVDTVFADIVLSESV